MAELTREQQERANRAAKAAAAFPDSVRFALITVLPNIVNGAFWGFTDIESVRPYAESLKKDTAIRVRKLMATKGLPQQVIVEVNPDYLVNSVAVAAPDMIDRSAISAMQEGMAKGAADFEKFLRNKADKNFRGAVGICCLNDTAAIAYKGVQHPAFRVSFETALTLLAKWGYGVVVNGTAYPADQIRQMGSEGYKLLKLSPTNTGVFIQIQSTLNTETLKALKAQYNMNANSNRR